jgi:uncharacterized protein YjbI with pentapeptide repeats
MRICATPSFDLSGSDLRSSDLRGIFHGSVVLIDAILEGAILPDGTRYGEEAVTTIQ